jgi:translocation and assembly module TamA
MNFLVRMQILLLFLMLLIGAQSILASKKVETIKHQLPIALKITPSDILVKKQMQDAIKDIQQESISYKSTDQKSYWQNQAKQTLMQILYSAGYYDSIIDSEVSDGADELITIDVKAGMRYKLGKIEIAYAPGSNSQAKHVYAPELKLQAGQYVWAPAIISAQDKIISSLEKYNCLVKLQVTHEARLDRENHTVDIKFIIDASKDYTIEKIQFLGLKSLKEEYARKFVKLRDGQCFKGSYVQQAKLSLQESTLFASVVPQVPEQNNGSSSVPLIFEVTERHFRTVKVGLNYTTELNQKKSALNNLQKGAGIVFSWENRNFSGRVDKLKADLSLTTQNSSLGMVYTLPFFLVDDQTLNVGGNLSRLRSSAFNNNEATLFSNLEKSLNKEWTIGGSGKFSNASVTMKRDDFKAGSRNDIYNLLSAPLFVHYDTRNNILHPKRGYNVMLEVTPFYSLKSRFKDKTFFKNKITGTTYLGFTNKAPQILLALKASYSNITAIAEGNIPTHERLFIGGMNSVRGYMTQFAGPINPETKIPIGGNSAIETSIELRTKTENNLGIVLFLDSGIAYSKLAPKNERQFRHGVGFGFRYFTEFGPLRVDLAFPIKRRKLIDKTYQLYLGIGQSF